MEDPMETGSIPKHEKSRNSWGMQHREDISKALGRKTNLSGRHPYLYPEEAAELIAFILEWSDLMCRPKITDMPTLVFFRPNFYFSFL
jgi:hypothetical protein